MLSILKQKVIVYKNVPFFSYGSVYPILRTSHDPMRARIHHRNWMDGIEIKRLQFNVENELGGKRAGYESWFIHLPVTF